MLVLLRRRENQAAARGRTLCLLQFRQVDRRHVDAVRHELVHRAWKRGGEQNVSPYQKCVGAMWFFPVDFDQFVVAESGVVDPVRIDQKRTGIPKSNTASTTVALSK